MVSVIIPVYNVAPYLRACLDSIIAAVVKVDGECERLIDGFAIEAICVDDGSTDGSSEVLDEYAERVDWIKVIHQENQGVSVARNRALDVAKGDWVLFLDADDMLAHETFAYLSAAAKVCGDDVGMLAFGSVRSKDAFPAQAEPFLATDCKMLFYDDFVKQGYHRRELWEGCYRRAEFGGLRFRIGLTMGEDRLYQAEVLAQVKMIALIPSRLYFYRMRSGSAVNSGMSIKKLIDRVTYRLAADEVLDRANRRPVDDERVHALFMTECFSRDYFVLNKADRKIIRPFWDKALTHYLNSKYAPVWCRFASWIALALPFEWVRFLLFRVPFWVKRKGIHR